MKYYNLQEASEILKIGIQSIRRYIRLKEIKAKKIGRSFVIEENDLKAFIKRRYGTDNLKQLEAITKAL